MLNLLRCSFMIGMLVFVALAAALEQPDLAHDFHLGDWNLAALQRQLAGNPTCDSDYDGLSQALTRRFERRDNIVKDLIAGQITLFEAAALFRNLDQEIPGPFQHPYNLGDSTEERLCWEVIRWVRANLRSAENEETGTELVARLELDLRRHKVRNGFVVLPNIVPTH